MAVREQRAGSSAISGTTGPASGSVLGPGVKVTLYVDRDTDDFMEHGRVEGLTARPKVDVSRSAVVRLALRRLMQEMTPAEVKGVPGTAGGSVGRAGS